MTSTLAWIALAASGVGQRTMGRPLKSRPYLGKAACKAAPARFAAWAESLQTSWHSRPRLCTIPRHFRLALHIVLVQPQLLRARFVGKNERRPCAAVQGDGEFLQPRGQIDVGLGELVLFPAQPLQMPEDAELQRRLGLHLHLRAGPAVHDGLVHAPAGGGHAP